MVVYYDEDNFSIKLYRDCVKGELVGLTEVIPIDELLEVWQKHKADTPQTDERQELEAYRKCIQSRSFWDAKHCDGCIFYDDCPFNPREDEGEPNNSEKPNN